MSHSVYLKAATLKETIANAGEGPYHTDNSSSPPTPPFAKLSPVLTKMQMDIRSTDGKWPAGKSVIVDQECNSSVNSVASSKIDPQQTVAPVTVGTKV